MAETMDDLKEMKKLLKKLLHNIEADNDAVKVVRCKDCKYYQNGVIFTDIKFRCRLRDKDGKPRRYNYCEDDFCSYGERREDDGCM